MLEELKNSKKLFRRREKRETQRKNSESYLKRVRKELNERSKWLLNAFQRQMGQKE